MRIERECRQKNSLAPVANAASIVDAVRARELSANYVSCRVLQQYPGGAPLEIVVIWILSDLFEETQLHVLTNPAVRDFTFWVLGPWNLIGVPGACVAGGDDDGYLPVRRHDRADVPGVIGGPANGNQGFAEVTHCAHVANVAS